MANHGNEKVIEGINQFAREVATQILMHQTEQYHGGKMEKTCLVLMS